MAYGAMARVCLAQPTVERLRQAEALISTALAAAEAHGRTGHVIELLLLQALALHAQGKADPALTVLSRSLLLAEPEGYVRMFVDAGSALVPLLRLAKAQGIATTYVTRLLDAFPELDKETRRQGDKERGAYAEKVVSVSRGLPVPVSMVEALTPRELEVVRLLAAGLSNAEIAERLVITVGTTKRHVLHIYGKLDVRSRAQAIVKLRELGLVE
jgi:LuxR family maltose regulon positive regulatory protein